MNAKASTKLKVIPSLKGRNLLTLNDVSDNEMLGLIKLAEQLKTRNRLPVTRRKLLLQGKNIALVFEKASTRTRCAATVAAADEGAHAEYLSKNDIHFGRKESIADSARVLGRMFDGILFRGYEHQTVVKLAKHAGVPVWNGLTDDAHPTQILADLLTIKEHFGHLSKLKVVFLGDGRNNVSHSLIEGCAKAGVNVTICCPAELNPNPAVVKLARVVAARNGCRVEIMSTPAKAVKGANVLYTDVWASMGEESKFEARRRLLRPYQVNMTLARLTGNLDNGQLIFLHCLPAFHNKETEITRELGALEVTDDVFEAPFSKVFDQAENRMHTIKAMMVATMS